MNKINFGPGMSRRHGAELASGEYLCFCDSDDWFSPSVLSDVDKEIEKEGSDLVIFDMTYLLKGKEIRKNYTKPFEYGDKMSYLSYCAESLCNLVVKRSLFLSIAPIDIRYGEDLALVPLIIINAQKVTHIDKSYYNYVMRSDSVSLGNMGKEAYNNMIQAFGHIKSHTNDLDPRINQCVEYLGIKTVLYNSTLMAIKGGNGNQLLARILSEFATEYPFWQNNPLKKQLGKAKNFYLWALGHRMWLICRAYVSLHSYLLTRR